MDGLTSLLTPTAPPSAGMTQIDPAAIPRVQAQQHVNGKHSGIAGVARDVLGTLGDFLLTRLHMPAMYGPAQHQRKLNEATAGFENDPLGAARAVGQVDFAAGQKMYDTIVDNQRQQALQASTIEDRTQRLQLAQEGVSAKTRGIAAAQLGALDRETDPAKRAALYQALRPQILALGTKYKTDFSDELPDQYDPDRVAAFMNGGDPIGRQRSQALTEERIDNQADQAATRDATTNRGITVRDKRAAAGQGITTRGQDLSHQDRVRQQDLSHGDRVSGQEEQGRHHRVTEGQRSNQLKKGDTRLIGGVLYQWDGEKAVPVKQ